MKRSVSVGILLLVLFTGTLMAGCRRTNSSEIPSPDLILNRETPTVEPGQTTGTSVDEAQPAYPLPPAESPSQGVYPIQEPEPGYPGPDNPSLPLESGPPFFIDEPVLAGSTQPVSYTHLTLPTTPYV